MDKNLDITFLPPDRRHLYDDDKRVGTLSFTTAERAALLELVSSKGWDVLKHSYVRQRLMQIASTSINVAQDDKDLYMFKGKAAEANEFVKSIEKEAKKLKDEEKAKNAKQS